MEKTCGQEMSEGKALGVKSNTKSSIAEVFLRFGLKREIKVREMIS